MKARVFQLDTDEHRAVEALLPWYVNGTLPQEELALVRSHLAQCARCQADAAWQDRLRSARPAMEPAPNAEVDRHWAALSGRLASPETPWPRWSAPLGGWLRARWLPLALGAQGALLIAVLVTTWMAAPQRDETFYALGAAPAAVAANALVVFRPTATEADIRNALRANRAQLVGGPTVTDAYLLHLPALSAGDLARLRADTAVLRVESLEGAAP